jgi:hypothetical protein
LSNTSRVLSVEEGLLASKGRKRFGLALAPHSMVTNAYIAFDGLQKAHLTSIPTAGRKTLTLLDGVTGRDRPMIGAVPNNRDDGWAKRDAPPGPTEHAMMEAAIQLDLITPEQAEALVEKGKTLGEWLLEQEKGEAGKAKKVKLRMLDGLGLLALLLLNFAVLVGFGWIVLRAVRSLV